MNWNLESPLSPGKAPGIQCCRLMGSDCSSAVDLENSRRSWQLGEHVVPVGEDSCVQGRPTRGFLMEEERS